ncbi:MAG: glycosyltransferase family 4 protein [Methanomassiliicoccales archaeon]|nr:MAG: glycosyltransferase family 4 protein [Methanomassiliicoccales archaeon]
MKVCFITPYSLRTVSGVSRVVEDLCKGLKEKKIDHLVISGRLIDEIQRDKTIEAIEIDVSKFPHLKDTYLAIKTVICIIRHRKEIDLLHLQSPHLQPMCASILGKILGKPVITTIHGKFPEPKSILRKLFFRATIKGTITFSDKITFVDAEARKHYKVPSAEIIQNGIDTKHYSPDSNLREETRTKLGLSDNDLVLIYLGRLAANKGVYELIDAFSSAKKKTNKGLKLILVGPGRITEINRRINALGLKNDVLVLGKAEDVKGYYLASDVFVLYSAFEGLPMVLLEASSCGLVIIATRVGGIPTLIRDKANGLLVDYGDKKGLIQKIKMIAEDDGLRENLGQNARKRVIEHYSLDRTITNYVKLYENMLQTRLR